MLHPSKALKCVLAVNDLVLLVCDLWPLFLKINCTLCIDWGSVSWKKCSVFQHVHNVQRFLNALPFWFFMRCTLQTHKYTQFRGKSVDRPWNIRAFVSHRHQTTGQCLLSTVHWTNCIHPHILNKFEINYVQRTTGLVSTKAQKFRCVLEIQFQMTYENKSCLTRSICFWILCRIQCVPLFFFTSNVDSVSL